METISLWDTYLPHYTEEFFLLIPKLSPSSFPQRGLHKPHTQHNQEEPKTKVTGADLLLALTSPTLAAAHCVGSLPPRLLHSGHT